MSGIPITMRYEKTDIKFLKEQARKRSFEENKDILYTDLIREAIYKQYPEMEKRNDEKQ